MVTYRDNPLVIQALEAQGFWIGDGGDADGATNYLDTEGVSRKCAEVFLAKPADARPDDYVGLLSEVQSTLGFTRAELLDKVVPGFRAKHQLTDAEQQLLEIDSDRADLLERKQAIEQLEGLLWGAICKDSRTGEVQQVLASKGYLLVEIAKAKRDGATVRLKVATNDEEMILRHFVDTKGKKLVSVSGTVTKDVSMVTDTFPAMGPKVKAALGVLVTSAVMELTTVADVNSAAIAARQKQPKELDFASTAK